LTTVALDFEAEGRFLFQSLLVQIDDSIGAIVEPLALPTVIARESTRAL
jgi:hypothetical protein